MPYEHVLQPRNQQERDCCMQLMPLLDRFRAEVERVGSQHGLRIRVNQIDVAILRNDE
jgi:hypothetical protein